MLCSVKKGPGHHLENEVVTEERLCRRPREGVLAHALQDEVLQLRAQHAGLGQGHWVTHHLWDRCSMRRMLRLYSSGLGNTFLGGALEQLSRAQQSPIGSQGRAICHPCNFSCNLAWGRG